MPPGSVPGSWSISLICWQSLTRHFIIIATLNLRWIQQHRDEVVPSRTWSLISKWEQVQICFSAALPNTSWMKVIIFFWWSILLGCLYLNVPNRALWHHSIWPGSENIMESITWCTKESLLSLWQMLAEVWMFPYATVFLESANTLTSSNKFLRKHQQASPSCALS